MNTKKKCFSLLVASSFLLASCGTVANDSESTGGISDGSVASSSSMKMDESLSVSSESMEAESASESSSDTSMSEGSTELNNEEAAMIERAKAKITELTEYVEGNQYLYLIEGVEGSVVSINVRENGKEVASSTGFYQYDDRTDSLQEMDIITGEYEDFPANE